MIWNFSHLCAFQMDFLMNVSSLQQEHKMTTMRVHSWPSAVYMAGDNTNCDLECIPGSLSSSSDISQGRAALWKENTPCFFETWSVRWPTPPARPLVSTAAISLPVASHPVLSAPARSPLPLGRPPPGSRSRSALLSMPVSASPSSRNQMSKNQSSCSTLSRTNELSHIGAKVTWLCFCKKQKKLFVIEL